MGIRLDQYGGGARMGGGAAPWQAQLGASLRQPVGPPVRYGGGNVGVLGGPGPGPPPQGGGFNRDTMGVLGAGPGGAGPPGPYGRYGGFPMPPPRQLGGGSFGSFGGGAGYYPQRYL